MTQAEDKGNLYNEQNSDGLYNVFQFTKKYWSEVWVVKLITLLDEKTMSMIKQADGSNTTIILLLKFW